MASSHAKESKFVPIWIQEKWDQTRLKTEWDSDWSKKKHGDRWSHDDRWSMWTDTHSEAWTGRSNPRPSDVPITYREGDDNTVFFYDSTEGAKNSEFTNFHMTPITIDGEVWPSSEHYFQAQRFSGAPPGSSEARTQALMRDYIRKLDHPRKAFACSRGDNTDFNDTFFSGIADQKAAIRRLENKDWDRNKPDPKDPEKDPNKVRRIPGTAVKDVIMEKVLFAKFRNPALWEKLDGTGNKVIVENAQGNDAYWGNGPGETRGKPPRTIPPGGGFNALGRLLMKVRTALRKEFKDEAEAKAKAGASASTATSGAKDAAASAAAIAAAAAAASAGAKTAAPPPLATHAKSTTASTADVAAAVAAAAGEKIPAPSKSTDPSTAASASGAATADAKHHKTDGSKHDTTSPATTPARLLYMTAYTSTAEPDKYKLDVISRPGVKSYEEKLADMGTHPTRAVFIFPSNASHHTPNTTLYTNKGGTGLGVPADKFGKKGWPVLGMPTEESLTRDDSCVKKAMEDIWKAIGFGLDIVLPVRPTGIFTNEKKEAFFKEGKLNGSPDNEPSFWGDTFPNGNPDLAKYYLTQLNLIQNFTTTLDAKSIPAEFKAAYAEGLAQRANPTDRFFVNPKAAPAPEATASAGKDDKKDVATAAAAAEGGGAAPPPPAPSLVASAPTTRAEATVSTGTGSCLTAANPTSGSKRVDSPSAFGFQDPIKIRKLAGFLEEKGWKQEVPPLKEPGAPTNFFKDNDGKRYEFSVYAHKIETQSKEQGSFVAMLEAFKKLHEGISPPQLPRITTYPGAKTAWEAALKAVYDEAACKTIAENSWLTDPNPPPVERTAAEKAADAKAGATAEAGAAAAATAAAGATAEADAAAAAASALGMKKGPG